ncbi:MAG: hypothetical protein QOD58_4829 [Mycobacterium sp.]|jgi:hypothetical protein|nr:hypothetical protein [Mycobacterium sp.]
MFLGGSPVRDGVTDVGNFRTSMDISSLQVCGSRLIVQSGRQTMCGFSAGMRFLRATSGELCIAGGDGLAIGKIGPPTDQFVPTCGGQLARSVRGLRHKATLDR